MKKIFALLLMVVGVGGLHAQETQAFAKYMRSSLTPPVLRDGSIAPVQAIPLLMSDPSAQSEVGTTQYGLSADETLGATDVELSAPQYYLGDKIEPPEGDIDWEKIAETISSYPENFLVDAKGEAVYAVAGGSATFSWPMVNNTTIDVPYQIAYSCQGRPKRVFWTNTPYKGPVVALNGSFVKLHGDSKLLECQIEREYYPGSEILISETVLHGIYIDEESNSIHVVQGDRQTYGDLRGQFVVAYYDSGFYENLLGLQVVEVTAPEPVNLSAYVGKSVEPHGDGFPVDGLVAYPETITPTDDLGPYYYQHLATDAKNPQNRKVYPLRPTDSVNMRLQVWWKEADAFDTLWPFELSVYTCEWDPKPLTQVVDSTGGVALPLSIPVEAGYSVSYERYNENVASIVINEENQSVNVVLDDAKKEGLWTLTLRQGDRVFYVPVRSVANTNTEWFSAEAVEWLVGDEILPRGGEASGLETTRGTEVDETLAGYIHEKNSDGVWNGGLYRSPADTAVVEGSEVLPSAIFPVRASEEGKSLEVWWQGSYQQEGMLVAIASPVVVQRYAPRWPSANEAPAIVLASGLGSAGKSEFESGKAMHLATSEANLPLPTRQLFGEGGSVAFWIRPGEAGEVMAVRSGDERLALEFSLGEQAMLNLTLKGKANNSPTPEATEDGGESMTTTRTLSAELGLVAGEWNFVVLTLDAPTVLSRQLTVWVNGKKIKAHPLNEVAPTDATEEEKTFYLTDVLVDDATGATSTGASAPLWPRDAGSGSIATALVTSGVIGASGETNKGASVGTTLDEISFWRKSLSETEITALQYTHPSKDMTGCILAYTFEEEGDLEVLGTTNVQRLVTDSVTGVKFYSTHVLASVPGAPLKGSGIIISDSEPVIYRQPDVNAVGYNPNEEHAFVRAGSGGYVVWAFRCDLNKTSSSAPGVLVSYSLGGRAKMKWLGVQATSSDYPRFEGTCTAGAILPGPHPFDLMQEPWLKDISWKDADKASCPAYRDRKGQVWARRDGTLNIEMFYRNDPTFDWPDGYSVAANDAVQWLPTGNNAYCEYGTNTPVENWTWTIDWPKAVPEIKLGQTLTTAVNGLPEVWNAKSLALVYCDADVTLFDPTVIRTTGFKSSADLSTVSDLVRYLGLTPGENGVSYKGGRYTFGNAPASIADRFYLDAMAEITDCIRLRGELEEKNAGTNMLYLNIINEEERQELANLFLTKEGEVANKWRSLFFLNNSATSFAKEAVEPSETAFKTREDGKGNPVELQTKYTPVDHYALTATGLDVVVDAKSEATTVQSGYVTLLENDDTNTDRVDEGDPISMHVVKVVPELYSGQLLVREDPTNLLSQQLSLLYTEGFAGKAENYTFEWKWADPTTSGRVPENYEEGYFLHAKEEGLTRFLVGTQGDTLENLVNRYYVMRYRPKNGSDELEMLKQLVADGTGEDPTKIADDDPRLWSDWCGPTLAEGWIQRVLNNITPFTQRMTDLYTNPTETAVSMIQQAGGPYTGDVALNQDNLTNVGLIQLYATLLNKAESMSVNQTIGTAAVNDQLLLAATRLADLYCVLGDEAYADALNPTIGFGSEFARLEDANLGLDYGALSTGLFCFDNQVSSLLDEELALLRGRSAEDAPSKQSGPWYNRLMWNFTKGINAGEVAYAVNYNITGSESGILDEETAAKYYPQGHGDAYGHYLSAVKAYYRLLRNPNFSWGAVGMGEMLLADAVVNVDYYEENRFGELAGALAKTAASVMERTAQKAWRDNGGTPGAGYLDEDRTRAFGYGEWGTRSALGAFYGWAVGNSLLPAGPQPDTFWQFRAIAEEESDIAAMMLINLPETCSTTQIVKMGENSETDVLAPFTFEFQLEATEEQPFATSETTTLSVISLDDLDKQGQFRLDWRVSDKMLIATYDATEIELGPLPLAERCLFALRRTITESAPYTHTLTALLLNARGETVWEVDLNELNNAPCFSFDGGILYLGGGLEGTFHEIRWWQNRTRSVAELYNARQNLISEEASLLFALQTYANQPQDTLLDAIGQSKCLVAKGTWEAIPATGLTLPYHDKGLLRIDRTTADDLNELPRTVTDIIATFDKLDRGHSPLGLAENSMPFDISPIGLEDGTQTHFEQILGRAEVALKNAAFVLDQVQKLGNRLRQIHEAQTSYEEQIANQEAALGADLVFAFGTPYSGDIGPGKLYVQDYDGPDLYHYMYMDLEEYGIDSVPSAESKKIVATIKLAEANYVNYGAVNQNLNVTDGETELELSYDLTADGFVAKPSDLTGTRRVYGSIQQSYADVLAAYINYKSKCGAIDAQKANLTALLDELKTVYSISESHHIISVTFGTLENALRTSLGVLSTVANAKKTASTMTTDSIDLSIMPGAASLTVIGTAAGTTEAKATIDKITNMTISLPLKTASTVATSAFEQVASYTKLTLEAMAKELALAGQAVALTKEMLNYRTQLRTQIQNYAASVANLKTAHADLIAKIQKMHENLYAAEGILAKRNRLRKQAADGIARMRYNDMFFRQLRNEALARYEKAFALAQRYTYLAAQAYDYETCQLTAGLAGEDFRGEIIAARSLGTLSEEGEPLLAGAHGDGGLADILARLKADYLVLKPRLGINNPKKELTWFSLRRELFRLSADENGDKAWKDVLSEAVVDDLRTHEVFRRFCRPLASSTDTDQPEPGLVIPFETTIDFAQNFFGKDLMGGDAAFSSTDFATRIAGVGIALEGYNVPAEGATGIPPLATTPQAYLVPAGDDYFRTPGDADQILRYTVTDQTVPLPYNVGQSEIDDPDWQPLYDGLTGGVDVGSRLRKYGSFRASVGDAEEEAASTRLIGRSVWNSRWFLIIPFGSMHGERELAKQYFIHGTSAYPGISDIRLGLRTYSHEGN